MKKTTHNEVANFHYLGGNILYSGHTKFPEENETKHGKENTIRSSHKQQIVQDSGEQTTVLWKAEVYVQGLF